MLSVFDRFGAGGLLLSSIASPTRFLIVPLPLATGFFLAAVDCADTSFGFRSAAGGVGAERIDLAFDLVMAIAVRTVGGPR